MKTLLVLEVVGVLVLIVAVISFYRSISLQKKNQNLKMFLAQITHEIRSPLNAIAIIAKLLEKEIKNDSAFDKIEQHVRVLIVGSNTTRIIVSNILDAATIESGKTDTSFEQTFYVRSLFTKQIELARYLGRPKNMKICLLIDRMPSVITSDPIKLNQIINNLLSNAIKYGSKNSTITLTVSAENASWKIEVKNVGPAIDEDRRKELFEAYVRGKEEITEGTGLGLYIVKNHVTAMNGSVQMDCIDEYTVFTIILPLQVGKLKDINEVEDTRLINLTNTKILIAEDEPSNANALSLYLEKIGCITEIAGNGRELLSKAMSHPPDIIMLDYDMPFMDGDTAFSQLKENPNLKYIPVIIITGSFSTEPIDKFLEAGADTYIRKPIDDPAELHKIISQQLSLHRAIQEL